MKYVLSSLLLTCLSITCQAGQAVVVDAKVKQLAGSRYTIDVTLEHGDEGWKHYANTWQVQTESGQVLGTRTLHHPHVNEQPFTRSLTLKIDPSIKSIFIQAMDSVHKANPVRFKIDLQ